MSWTVFSDEYIPERISVYARGIIQSRRGSWAAISGRATSAVASECGDYPVTVELYFAYPFTTKFGDVYVLLVAVDPCLVRGIDARDRRGLRIARGARNAIPNECRDVKTEHHSVWGECGRLSRNQRGLQRFWLCRFVLGGKVNKGEDKNALGCCCMYG